MDADIPTVEPLELRMDIDGRKIDDFQYIFMELKKNLIIAHFYSLL